LENNESLSKLYYDKLISTENKIPVLVNFLKDILEIRELPENIYRIFAKLYRIYGAELVYFAILDCSDMDGINIEGIDRLISYFSKKRLGETLKHLEVNLLLKNWKGLIKQMI